MSDLLEVGQAELVEGVRADELGVGLEHLIGGDKFIIGSIRAYKLALPQAATADHILFRKIGCFAPL